jgi:hypothetical protein
MKTKTDDSYNRQTVSDVYALYRLEERFRKIKSEYEERKKKLQISIKNYMFANGFDSFKFEDGQDNVKVNKICRRQIIWDVDKLEERIKDNCDKETANEVIVKRYFVNNMEGLTKYLKSIGADPKKFRQFISTEKSVDTDALNRLSEEQEITMEDVKGCYEVKETEPYLKIDVSSGEEG